MTPNRYINVLKYGFMQIMLKYDNFLFFSDLKFIYVIDICDSDVLFTKSTADDAAMGCGDELICKDVK